MGIDMGGKSTPGNTSEVEKYKTKWLLLLKILRKKKYENLTKEQLMELAKLYSNNEDIYSFISNEHTLKVDCKDLDSKPDIEILTIEKVSNMIDLYKFMTFCHQKNDYPALNKLLREYTDDS